MPGKRTLIGLAILVAVLSAGYGFLAKNAETRAEEEARFLLGRLPVQIETDGKVQIGGRDAIWHDGCGAAIFKLSVGTVDAIERAGLKYFDAALRPRDERPYEDERLNSLVVTRNGYKSWAKTPLPQNDKGLSGLDCLPHNGPANDPLVELIRRSTFADESYFTSARSGPGVTLLVIPKLRVVVYAYVD
jgi:hypothetical protein